MAKVAAKVFVMLSGGVDSSVAAARLVDAGYSVEAVYMQNWSLDRLSKNTAEILARSCNLNDDIKYAKATAKYLNIPFRVINFEEQYWNKVIEPFFAGYRKGLTPNPDIWCNQLVKYGVFLDWAFKQGADFVASGHYTRLRREIPKFKILNSKQIQKSKIQNSKKSGGLNNLNLDIISDLDISASDLSSIHLLRGIDESKDQSYFLSQVPMEKLQYALFPIGHLTKNQVRAEALMRGLPTATRPDSQGICFIGKVPIKEFLKERFKENIGEVQFIDGTKIGQHDGVFYYTIGQRISATEIQKSKKNPQNKITLKKLYSDMRKPLYIFAKDIDKNILYADFDEGKPPLWKKDFSAVDWNWFEKPDKKQIYDIEIRYHQQPKSKGKILNLKSKILNLVLEEPVRAVSAGQTVVLSRGDKIIGAGTIQ